MTKIQKKAIGIITSLSEAKLNIAVDYLSYLNDREGWEATFELYDDEYLKEILQGKEEIEKGEVVSFNEISKKELIWD